MIVLTEFQLGLAYGGGTLYALGFLFHLLLFKDLEEIFDSVEGPIFFNCLFWPFGAIIAIFWEVVYFMDDLISGEDHDER